MDLEFGDISWKQYEWILFFSSHHDATYKDNWIVSISVAAQSFDGWWIRVWKQLETIGYGTFWGCRSLRCFTIPQLKGNIYIDDQWPCDDTTSLIIVQTVDLVGRIHSRNSRLIASVELEKVNWNKCRNLRIDSPLPRTFSHGGNILQRWMESSISIDWERYKHLRYLVVEKGGSIVTGTCSTEGQAFCWKREHAPYVEKPQRRPRSM